MVEKTYSSGLWSSLAGTAPPAVGQGVEGAAPPAEASADVASYRIVVELPGVAESDVEVMVDDGVLVVKGRKSIERDDSGETWFFSERQFGAFQRSFRLPPDADAGKVTAELKDGLLTVRVEKKRAEQSNARTIRIARA